MRRRRIMPRVCIVIASLEDFLRPHKSSITLNMADTMDTRLYWYSEIRQGYGGALEQWCDGDPLDAIPEHLHRSILGFLLAKPVPAKRPRDLE